MIRSLFVFLSLVAAPALIPISSSSSSSSSTLVEARFHHPQHHQQFDYDLPVPRHHSRSHHRHHRRHSHSHSHSSHSKPSARASRRKLELLERAVRLIEELEEDIESSSSSSFPSPSSSVSASSASVDSADASDVAEFSFPNPFQKAPAVSTADYSNWMRDNMNILGGRTLQNLVLPGSHDSGTYQLGDTVANDPTVSADVLKLLSIANKFGIKFSGLINPWSQAQDKNLYDQAVGGMRYFDIRAAWQNNQWSIFHFDLGVPVSTCLNDIAHFLNDHRGEIALVEVSHFIGNPDQNALNQLVSQIQSAFGGLLLPRDGAFKKTVNQLVSENHRAVVTFADNKTVDRQPNLFYGWTFYNTYANSNNQNAMQSYNDQQVQKFNSQPLNGQIYKLSWTLTAQTQDIIDTFIPFKPNKLIQFADKVNPSLYNWGMNYLKQNKKIGGLILVDHYETSQVVNLAIEANKHN